MSIITTQTSKQRSNVWGSHASLTTTRFPGVACIKFHATFSVLPPYYLSLQTFSRIISYYTSTLYNLSVLRPYYLSFHTFSRIISHYISTPYNLSVILPYYLFSHTISHMISHYNSTPYCLLCTTHLLSLITHFLPHDIPL